MLERFCILLLALIGAAWLVLLGWTICRIHTTDAQPTHTANQVGIPERPVAGRVPQVASLEAFVR